MGEALAETWDAAEDAQDAAEDATGAATAGSEGADDRGQAGEDGERDLGRSLREEFGAQMDAQDPIARLNGALEGHRAELAAIGLTDDAAAVKACPGLRSLLEEQSGPGGRFSRSDLGCSTATG